jgi:RNA polymerase sigma-70 factor (ECF subfamily)
MRSGVVAAELPAPRVRTGVVTSLPRSVGNDDGEIASSVVAAARRGERQAFSTIIRHYERRLRGTAFQILHDRDLADDVVQDVFVAAYRALPRFRGDAALGTWLHRITYTTCAQHLRRAARRPRLISDECLPPRLQPTCDPLSAVVDRDTIQSALTQLTANQRFLVLLVDRDGYDYRSAARLLGVPRGTVASRLNVARARLRLALGLDSGPREEGR